MKRTKRTRPHARAERARLGGNPTTPRAPDDGRRGSVGVVASLAPEQDGTVRLVLDDVKQNRSHGWSSVGLFTSRDYSARDLAMLKITKRELERLGLNVLVRLLGASR